MQDTPSELNAIQREEVEENLCVWREAVSKLRKARISDRAQFQMLEGTVAGKSMKAVADRAATALAAKRKALKRLLRNSERDANELLKLLQPAPAQLHRIAMLASAVIRGRARHNEQLHRLMAALATAELSMRDAVATVETIDGDRRSVRPPIAWDAGAVANEFEKRAHVLPHETAVLVALYAHLGRWPISERDARIALETIVLSDSIEKVFTRIRQAQRRVTSAQVVHGRIVGGEFVPNPSAT